MRFPIKQKPLNNILQAPACFGARRNGGARHHAAIDIYCSLWADVVACEAGEVIRGPYDFYMGLFACEIRFISGLVGRYCELASIDPAIKRGAAVAEGSLIGKAGRVPGCPAMLHFELYQGTGSGPLTDLARPPEYRRVDLLNPTAYLLEGLKVSGMPAGGK